MTSDVFSDCLLLFRSLQIASEEFRWLRPASNGFMGLFRWFQTTSYVFSDGLLLFKPLQKLQISDASTDFR